MIYVYMYMYSIVIIHLTLHLCNALSSMYFTIYKCTFIYLYVMSNVFTVSLPGYLPYQLAVSGAEARCALPKDGFFTHALFVC